MARATRPFGCVVRTGESPEPSGIPRPCHVANGQMTIGQAMEVIARRERERELDRARQARRRQRKKLG